MININRYVDNNKLNFMAELCSAIIKEMTSHGHVHLYTKEAVSLNRCGLYQVLDQLCDYWKWEPNQFTISTPNAYETSNKYCINHIEYFYEGLTQDHFLNHYNLMIHQIVNIKPLPWDGSYDYGLFVGRANATRLRAIELHHKFEYRDRGLTSFLSDVNNHVDSQSLLTYLCDSDARWSEISSIKPYSDIGNLLPVPVMPPAHILGWEKIYQKIPIEIVCETSETEDSRMVTEKLFRPVLYKRPGLLIAGRNSLKNLTLPYSYLGEQFSFKTFNHVISDAYDQDEGIYRVDHVFDILHELISSGRIKTILEECHDDIEHNYQEIIRWFLHAEKHIKYKQGPISTELDIKK
jgi:hypothetical protein